MSPMNVQASPSPPPSAPPNEVQEGSAGSEGEGSRGGAAGFGSSRPFACQVPGSVVLGGSGTTAKLGVVCVQQQP